MRGYMMILFFQTWPDFTAAPLGLLQWLCPFLFLPWTPWTLSCPPKRKESVRLLRHPPRPPSHRPLHLHLRARREQIRHSNSKHKMEELPLPRHPEADFWILPDHFLAQNDAAPPKSWLQDSILDHGKVAWEWSSILWSSIFTDH